MNSAGQQLYLGQRLSPQSYKNEAEGHCQSFWGRNPEVAEQGETKMSAVAKI